jgi:hypothetical protein
MTGPGSASCLQHGWGRENPTQTAPGEALTTRHRTGVQFPPSPHLQNAARRNERPGHCARVFRCLTRQLLNACHGQAARIHFRKSSTTAHWTHMRRRAYARGWDGFTAPGTVVTFSGRRKRKPAAVGLPALLKMRYRVLGGFRVLRFLLGAFFLDGLDRLLCQVLVGCLVRHGVLLTAGDGLRPSS